MKLELGYVKVTDVVLGTESKYEDGVVSIDVEAVRKMILENEKIADVQLDVAKPGESTRITPVKDVIQPRVKVEGPGGVFPGVINKVDTVGSGKTYALEGMGVVTAGKIVGFQEGIIDMSGPGADYTPFSQLINLVLVITPIEGLPQHEYEQAVRMAGLKTAAYIGELARNAEPYRSVVYETPSITEGIKLYPDLPRVGYVMMLQSQGLLHDTYVYGVDAKRTLSTFIYPTEILDGAIISGNSYSIKCGIPGF